MLHAHNLHLSSSIAAAEVCVCVCGAEGRGVLLYELLTCFSSTFFGLLLRLRCVCAVRKAEVCELCVRG